MTDLAAAVGSFLVASSWHRSDQPNTPYVKIMGPTVDAVETVLNAARLLADRPLTLAALQAGAEEERYTSLGGSGDYMRAVVLVPGDGSE